MLRLPPLCWRNPAIRRPACSAVRPHMPSPPSPPALLTAAAKAGVLALPIGACRIGHLRFNRSVSAFQGHIAFVPKLRPSFHHNTPSCSCESLEPAPAATLPAFGGGDPRRNQAPPRLFRPPPDHH